MPSIQFLADHFLLYVLILARVGGLFATMPVFGTQSVPLQMRAFLTAIIALVMLPILSSTPPPQTENLLQLAIVMGREIVLGLMLGLSVVILFSGLQLAGQAIAQVSGLSLSDVYNPASDSNVPVFAQLYDATALGTFLLVGGHRMVIAALLDSFREMPAGHAAFSQSLLDALVHVTQQSFLTGIRASAPVLVSLVMATLIVGLVSRTLPQLNSMALGFSLNSLVLLGGMSLSLGAAVWAFQNETYDAIVTIRNGFGLAETIVEEEPPNAEVADDRPAS